MGRCMRRCDDVDVDDVVRATMRAMVMSGGAGYAGMGDGATMGRVGMGRGDDGTDGRVCQGRAG